MKGWKGFLMVLAIVACAGTAAAAPTIGVYFDQNATQRTAVLTGGVGMLHTAYVAAVDAEMLLGGMSFMLQVDPRIHIMDVNYPESLKIGEPDEGVMIAYPRCQPAWGTAVIGCVLTLWTGDERMTDAEITVVPNPFDNMIQVGDCEGYLTPAEGLTSYLTITVANDETSWGGIKGLYR